MKGSARRACALLGCLCVLPPLVPGCGDPVAPSEAKPFSTPPTLPAVRLSDVVRSRITLLSQSALAPVAGVGPGVEEGANFPVIDGVQAVDADEVRGLTEMLSVSKGSMRELALADARTLGPGAIGELIALAVDEELGFGLRATALEVLAALEDPRAEIALLELLRTLTEADLRTHAAWRLAEGQADCIVPALVLRMKYENDLSVLQWIATALARRGNFAGIEHLLAWGDDARHRAQREAARATGDALAIEAGYENADTLVAAWRGGDPQGLPSPEQHSVDYELACFLWMQRLGDYQLRGVDDSRYVLSRLDSAAAVFMGAALADENVYVRTHVAQALGRMGPRAKPAVPALMRALADPSIGARAAGALGAIGALEAQDLLLSLTAEGVGVGLRLAAVRALAQFGPAASEEVAQRLRVLFDAPPSADIWQAAGEGLLARDAGMDVARQLSSALEGQCPLGRLEPRTTHTALRAWLQRRADSGDPDAPSALEAWDAAAIDSPYFAPPQEDVQSMQATRRRLIEELSGGEP